MSLPHVSNQVNLEPALEVHSEMYCLKKAAFRDIIPPDDGL